MTEEMCFEEIFPLDEEMDFTEFEVRDLFSIRTSIIRRRECLSEILGISDSEAKKMLEEDFVQKFSRKEKPSRKALPNNLCYAFEDKWIVVSHEDLDKITGAKLSQLRKEVRKGPVLTKEEREAWNKAFEQVDKQMGSI